MPATKRRGTERKRGGEEEEEMSELRGKGGRDRASFMTRTRNLSLPNCFVYVLYS